MTRITAETLDKNATVTAIAIESLASDDWYIGAAVPKLPAAWLEISVTAGTNSEQQKAAFIAAAFTELEHQLGQGQGIEVASYVSVRELPATDWGYGGRSQSSRRTPS